MTPPRKKSEYEELRAIWYEKLKEEGFKDIESDEHRLKVWSSSKFSKEPVELWQAKEAYYSMAAKFLVDHKFEDKLERIVWEYYSNGMSVRDIATTLNKVGITQMKRTSIWEIISRLEDIMKTYYLVGYSDSKKN
jgi:hypothetical protein